MKFQTLLFFTLLSFCSLAQNGAMVIQTDFGTKDGAVAAMKGVAFGVDTDLRIFDLTHEIPAYNIWEAAYRLQQAAPYWPAGTVFVSVVDPGVGSFRKSVVLKTKSGHYFVTPDNGTLTLVAESLGVEAVREIDESINRLKNSQNSFTFHGRDVYAFTAARLASRIITFEQVGKKLEAPLVMIAHQVARKEGNKLFGTIDVLDVQYGNVWTNIPATMVNDFPLRYGDKISCVIMHDNAKVAEVTCIFGRTFSDVSPGEPIAYINSLGFLAFGLNQADFAKAYQVASGSHWNVTVTKQR